MNKAYKSVQEKNDANNSNRKKNQLKLYLYKFIKKKKKKFIAQTLSAELIPARQKWSHCCNQLKTEMEELRYKKLMRTFKWTLFSAWVFCLKLVDLRLIWKMIVWKFLLQLQCLIQKLRTFDQFGRWGLFFLCYAKQIPIN